MLGDVLDVAVIDVAVWEETDVDQRLQPLGAVLVVVVVVVGGGMDCHLDCHSHARHFDFCIVTMARLPFG